MFKIRSYLPWAEHYLTGAQWCDFDMQHKAIKEAYGV
jgi:hypothetical protein